MANLELASSLIVEAVVCPVRMTNYIARFLLFSVLIG